MDTFELNTYNIWTILKTIFTQRALDRSTFDFVNLQQQFCIQSGNLWVTFISSSFERKVFEQPFQSCSFFFSLFFSILVVSTGRNLKCCCQVLDRNRNGGVS